MATTTTLLALMSVIGLASCYPGFIGGYGGAFPLGGSYSQVTHHGSYGLGGLGGLGGFGGFGGLYGYGASLPVSSVSHVSHGAHYGGWGGLYGGVQVSQSPVRYHGYSVGAPHVQSYGVHYPTTTVTQQHGGYLGGYGGLAIPSSVSTVSHGIGHAGWGLGYGLNTHF